MAASAAEASLSVDGETVKGVVLEPEMLLLAEHLLLKGLGVLLQPMAAHSMLGMKAVWCCWPLCWHLIWPSRAGGR